MIDITEVWDSDGNGANLRFTNLAEFMRKLNLVANEYPKTTEKHLRAVGNKLKTMARKNTPVGKTAERYIVKHGKHKGKSRRSKIKLKNRRIFKLRAFS